MNSQYKKSVAEFLNIKNVAIAGYSTNKSKPANHIYKRFNENGYNVYAVNPKDAAIDDVKCYNSLGAVPGIIDGVVICTPPIVTPSVIRECIRLGIINIWMHRSFDEGSYSEHAEELCKENGINCISIGCPMMFLKADIPHKCIKWVLDISGRLKN